ncbi:MAG: N-acylmannosamine 1-dehydrogenase [Herbaspirillum sp.]|nr:N-acylmannosamine 1-dehydrogenase [Herbaspirillum sp.]
MNVKDEVKMYSGTIGRDPLLIQGAGGNVSWKEGGTLWIKASGTWLADAQSKDIFVPIDLAQARTLIAAGASDLSSARQSDSALRPSIETALHALLPHRIVVHFHAVEVIAIAVLADAQDLFERRLAGLNWTWIDYVKPGPDLAQAVASALSGDKTPDILVLGNHGLVIAADSVQEIDRLLREIRVRCEGSVRTAPSPAKADCDQLASDWRDSGYKLPQNPLYHVLGIDATSLAIARKAWVLYPDHAVFLGGHATVVEGRQTLLKEDAATRPECIIVAHQGVVVRDDLNAGQLAMLACYVDVVLRLDEAAQIAPLSTEQIASLLNWDAEKYRQSLNAI